MAAWIVLAKGPIFYFILTIFVFGLLRLILLTTWDIIVAIWSAGDRQLPYRQIALQTASWLFPLNQLHRNRVEFSLASFSLHIGVLVVSLFLRNHLDFLHANTGISWIAIKKPILDAITLMAIFGIVFLLLFRLYVTGSRKLSKASDYMILLLLLNIFLSGFLAGRSWNPLAYNGLMLFHTLNGMTLLLTIPFSKVAHCVLFPLVRLGTEVAWHFTPYGGSEAVKNLHGPKGRKI
jgi:nitrate reductase gamma subunit